MPSPFVLLFLFHFYQFCAETAIAIFHFHLSRTHTSLCFPFAVFFFVAIIVSFDLFSVSSDFRWHSTLFCLLFGFGRVVLATLQRPCCANICHLTLVSLLVSVSFTALLFSLLLLFSFSSLSFWWGLWFSGSAFDLRCLIAGVVCGLQPWSIVNAFAHAAHKFLATFYVFFVLFFCFFGATLPCPSLRVIESSGGWLWLRLRLWHLNFGYFALLSVAASQHLRSAGPNWWSRFNVQLLLAKCIGHRQGSSGSDWLKYPLPAYPKRSPGPVQAL